MKIPGFLKENGTIGISALSAGVGHKLESFDRSLKRLGQYFRIIETADVRVNGVRSNTAEKRASEFNELVRNDEIDFIMIATGGDYLMETLPYIDWEYLAEHPKFVMGSSDPTFLMYTMTTKYDIATIYGHNAGSFDEDNFHPCLRDAIEIMKGNLLDQHSFDKFESNKDFEASAYNLDADVNWISVNGGDISVTGIMAGGCLDVIVNLMGTIYDGTADFIRRYPQGIIWFFDVYEMNAAQLYLSMLQLKYAGYFETAEAVIIGRVLFTRGSKEEEYLELLRMAFDIPVVFNADIGHTEPTMTFVCGVNTTLEVSGGKGVIRQWL